MSSSPSSSESGPGLSARAAANKPAPSHRITADTPYDSALKPALWLFIPFVLTLIYGYFY